jgi:Plasmid pRiA4b ORF-3-like protein
MAGDPPIKVYQLHVWLREISPMIWRRLLVQSDTTIADLHYTLQIAFGWSDSHLHRFVIYGKDYGIAYSGGIHFTDDPTKVRLHDFRFCPHVRFLYEYDFSDQWQHQIRVERLLPLDPTKSYPLCIGGARAAPPEDCGGPRSFLALKQQYSLYYIAERLIALFDADPHAVAAEELQTLQDWLTINQFDRRAVNRRL